MRILSHVGFGLFPIPGERRRERRAAERARELLGLADRVSVEHDLSRVLWDSRETAEMYADVVEARTGQRAVSLRELVARIDAYRAARGWPSDGF